ncbi:hypothetical protein MASR2M79_15710 [Aminivibrio sp.]
MVGSGPNSALPHYSKSARIIEKKDIVLKTSVDIRDIVLIRPELSCRHSSEEQKKIYSIVLEGSSAEKRP